MKINRDDSQIFIEPEQRRMASARQGRDCSFAHPFFPDELFHDLRNCAPLQSGTPCQIRARKRLAGADQLQHDIPVDSSRSFAGRKLNIGQIDVANAFDILSVLQLFLSRKPLRTRSAVASGQLSVVRNSAIWGLLVPTRMILPIHPLLL
jgi:hypothetical protein